jgi:diguanylate cyclase (GGDEF)-like protein
MEGKSGVSSSPASGPVLVGPPSAAAGPKPTPVRSDDLKSSPFFGSSAAPAARLRAFFAVRLLAPVFTLVALAASTVLVDHQRVAALLTAQVAFAVATYALTLNRAEATTAAVWTGVLADLAVITALCALTGGTGGPLTFLFTLEALAAGILLGSRLGLRVLALATGAIVALDLAGAHGWAGIAGDDGLHGLGAIAALWALAGGAGLFSLINERELRRHGAQLETMRRITLDIEDTLSVEEILEDLCRGVVHGFGFTTAAALISRDGMLVCAGGYNVTGPVGRPLERRGPLDRALSAGGPIVVPAADARVDGALIDLLGPRGYVAVPLGREGLLVATRMGRGRRPPAIRKREIDMLGGLAQHAALALANANLHARVAAMAVTDPLTGLANHGEFHRRLSTEAGRLERYTSLHRPGHHTSVVLADVDLFKRLNDTHGHQVGDEVLRHVSDAIRGAVRGFDTAARYGGEEFGVVLPETDEEGARAVAERIRVSVKQATGRGTGVPATTISIGCATAPEDGMTPGDLVAAADRALYRAKEAGRDRVMAAGDLRRRVRKVVALKRRRTKPVEPRARVESRPARVRSSRPIRRTPRG